MNDKTPTHARFRVQTVSYYDVPLDKLEERYSTDDVVEAAQIDQAEFRKDDSTLITLIEHLDSEVYVQVFDPGGQMFTDEAIREFIQIIRIEDFEIHIDEESTSKDRQVHAHLNGFINGVWMAFNGYGKTMGFALRDVREQLRQLTGK